MKGRPDTDEFVEPTEFSEAVDGVRGAIRRGVCEPLNEALEEAPGKLVVGAMGAVRDRFTNTVRGVLNFLVGETREDD